MILQPLSTFPLPILTLDQLQVITNVRLVTRQALPVRTDPTTDLASGDILLAWQERCHRCVAQNMHCITPIPGLSPVGHIVRAPCYGDGCRDNHTELCMPSVCSCAGDCGSCWAAVPSVDLPGKVTLVPLLDVSQSFSSSVSASSPTGPARAPSSELSALNTPTDVHMPSLPHPPIVHGTFTTEPSALAHLEDLSRLSPNALGLSDTESPCLQPSHSVQFETPAPALNLPPTDLPVNGSSMDNYAAMALNGNRKRRTEDDVLDERPAKRGA